MGYKFQFVTLAGFHALNHAMFELARDYRDRGMAAYSELQQEEFAAEKAGYTATRHQREVGTGYFDKVLETITGGHATTAALADSTEAAQFTGSDRLAAAERVMDADHAELKGFVNRVKSAPNKPALVDALECLGAFLGSHFEREERDDGMFGILAQRGTSEPVDELLRQHRLLLEEVHALVANAREGLDGRKLGEGAAKVAEQLAEHERREHALAERHLGAGH